MNNGFEAENILRVFPEVLRRNPKIEALGKIIAGYLSSLTNEAGAARLYTNIDALPEAVLDQLAYDFKVDWWDGAGDIETKQDVFRQSFLVHKRIGTAFAVRSAMEAAYAAANVEEWQDYGGKPYRFRVTVEDQEMTPGWVSVFLQQLRLYKNVRSILERITLRLEAGHTLYTGFALHYMQRFIVTCAIPSGETLVYLTDANDDLLADGLGNRFIDVNE